MPTTRQCRRSRRRQDARRLFAESLEDRRLLATLTVDVLQDVVNGNTSAGDLSLREAITIANGNAEADTINLPPGTLSIGLSGINDDSNATGDFDVSESNQLTIIGQGPGITVVDGASIDRVFDVLTGANLELRT